MTFLINKRETVIRDVSKGEVFHWFIRWKKFVALQKATEIQKIADEGRLDTKEDNSTVWDEQTLNIEKYKRLNEMNTNIYKNQLMIGKSLYSEVSELKQKLINDISKYKSYFSDSKGEMEYKEILRFWQLVGPSQE